MRPITRFVLLLVAPAVHLLLAIHPDEGFQDLILTAHRLSEQGKYREAEGALRAALREVQGVPGAEDRAGQALNNLGNLYLQLGRCDDARTSLLRAMRTWNQIGAPSWLLIRTGLNLVSVYMDCGDADAARRFVRATIQPLLAGMDSNSPESAVLLQQIAVLRMGEKQDVMAEQLASSAIGIWERTGQAAGDRFALALDTRACARIHLGRYEEAFADSMRALEVLDGSSAHPRSMMAKILSNAGTVHQLTGHPDEAEPFFKRALALLGESPHPAILHNYAALLRSLGRKREARGIEARAVAVEQTPVPRRQTADISEFGILH